MLAYFLNCLQILFIDSGIWKLVNSCSFLSKVKCICVPGNYMKIFSSFCLTSILYYYFIYGICCRCHSMSFGEKRFDLIVLHYNFAYRILWLAHLALTFVNYSFPLRKYNLSKTQNANSTQRSWILKIRFIFITSF